MLAVPLWSAAARVHDSVACAPWRAPSPLTPAPSPSPQLSPHQAYRRALLLVHADKMSKEPDVRKKYIADLVFDALKEAWITFEAAERP